MTELAIAPVIEGHGEQGAVPILLRRVAAELLDIRHVNVLRPIRVPRSKLIKPEELLRAVSLADLKLRNAPAKHKLALVIFDADEDAACQLSPLLLGSIQTARPDIDVTIVLPVPEFETWFVAAAESLHDYINVALDDIPSDPEEARAKKGWIEKHFRGRYTETIEQPALTARMDLRACRRRSKSFDKLCRELEKRVE